jgi:hypothetical protein
VDGVISDQARASGSMLENEHALMKWLKLGPVRDAEKSRP